MDFIALRGTPNDIDPVEWHLNFACSSHTMDL